MEIFFSWSGDLSNKTAKIFKTWLTDKIFEGEDVNIFISEEDIQYGADWFKAIREAIKKSCYSIVFLDKTNIQASWLNFEAGALALNEPDRPVAVLFSGSQEKSFKSPLKHYQFFTPEKSSVKKLIQEIKLAGNFKIPSDKHIDAILDTEFPDLQTKLLRECLLSEQQIDSSKFVVFPEHIKKVKPGRVFIGSPMCRIPDDHMGVC